MLPYSDAPSYQRGGVFKDERRCCARQHKVTFVILPCWPAKYFDWSLQVADIKTETIVSRGEIVHLPSLIKALEAKKMWGVALDVFEGEKK